MESCSTSKVGIGQRKPFTEMGKCLSRDMSFEKILRRRSVRKSCTSGSEGGKSRIKVGIMVFHNGIV